MYALRFPWSPTLHDSLEHCFQLPNGYWEARFQKICEFRYRVGYAIEKMSFAFEEAAVAEGTHGLHQTNENETRETIQKLCPLDHPIFVQGLQIVVEQPISGCWWNVGWWIVEE